MTPLFLYFSLAAADPIPASKCDSTDAFALIDDNLPNDAENFDLANYDWRIIKNKGEDSLDWQVWVWCLPPWKRYRVWVDNNYEEIYDREQRWVNKTDQVDYFWKKKEWKTPEADSLSEDDLKRTHDIYNAWKEDRLSSWQQNSGRSSSPYIRSVGGLGYCNGSQGTWRWSRSSDLPSCPDYDACPETDWEVELLTNRCLRKICQNTCPNGTGSEAAYCSQVTENCSTCNDGYGLSAGKCVKAAVAAQDNADRNDIKERLKEADAKQCKEGDLGCISISLMWDNDLSYPNYTANDLDLYLEYTDDLGITETVWYKNKWAFGAELDVDRYGDEEKSVENIIVPKAKKGKYEIIVKNHTTYHDKTKEFTVVDNVFGVMDVNRRVMSPMKTDVTNGEVITIKTFNYVPRS